MEERLLEMQRMGTAWAPPGPELVNGLNPRREKRRVMLADPAQSPSRTPQTIMHQEDAQPIAGPSTARQSIHASPAARARPADAGVSSPVYAKEADISMDVDGVNTVSDEDENDVDAGMDDDDDEDGEEGEDAEEGEGEEGDGSDDEEEGEAEEEEEEDDDEEDDDDDDAASEDLEGDIEVTGATIVAEAPLAPKTEPRSPSALPMTVDALPAEGATDAEGANVLVPKKKGKKRARSADDLPPPPPPMQTIRLERKLMGPNETLEWNILEDAKEQGMVIAWGEEDKPEDDEGVVAATAAGPSGAGGDAAALGPPGGADPFGGDIFGMDGSAEEIAARLEAKYGDKKPKKKIKRTKKEDQYDPSDDFIDDSELLMDAPTHMAQTVKEGFFVHSGPLEIRQASPPARKPKATRARPSAAGGPAAPPAPQRKRITTILNEKRRRLSMKDGTSSSPIKIDSDDEAGPSSRKPSMSPMAEPEYSFYEPKEPDRQLFKAYPRDPKFQPPFSMFPPELRAAMLDLRKGADQHAWQDDKRGKFPESLKPLLKKAGEAAYRYEQFGPWDQCAFFSCLPACLPYNEFTLKKLITKTCYDGMWQWLSEVEEEGIRQFQAEERSIEQRWVSKYQQDLETYEREAAEWDAQHPTSVLAGTDAASAIALDIPAAAPPNGGAAGYPDGDDEEAADQAVQPGGRPKPPAKRFPWSEDMRTIFAELVENKRTMVLLNQKASEWGVPSARNPEKAKEYGEKLMNQKLNVRIIACFPAGFCDGTIISREKSRLIKLKKEAATQAADA